jgi:hypothetical protein
MSEADRNHLRDGVMADYSRYTRLQRGMLLMMIIGAVLFIVGLIGGLVVLIFSKKQAEVSWFPTSHTRSKRVR